MDNKRLTDQQKAVLRDGATEAPGSGKLLNHSADGDYQCADCGSKLFESDAKFESKQPGLQGWPSFDKAVDGAIELKDDDSMFMHRTEVVCANCGGHLGHVFDADDASSGKHYCINSCSLNFEGQDGQTISGASDD